MLGVPAEEVPGQLDRPKRRLAQIGDGSAAGGQVQVG
jgi:hypothetical protein